MRLFYQLFLVLTVTSAGFSQGAPALAAPAIVNEADVSLLIMKSVFADPDEQAVAVALLKARGKPDAVAALLLAMRFRGAEAGVKDALKSLTGIKSDDFDDFMLWQEAHPQVTPHPAYHDAKLQLLQSMDPQFMRFLGKERGLQQNMRIRLEEIEWGGVFVDGIPALDNPKLIAAERADYLGAENLVFGVSINGDARAYPLRIMGWHEMFNEVIGGVPVALAYCTLCGSGILYETKVEGHKKPLIFGSSGFLYRSNKLMFDRETDSLWNQFTGEPVVGPLAKSGIHLKVRPVTITTWAKWQAENPNTKVLALNTGFKRDYGEGVVYNDYFASKDLMFPAIVGDESIVKRKDFVFGMRDFGEQKAWPLKAFATTNVINDKLGETNIVLIGDEATRTVRAYERKGIKFNAGADDEYISAGKIKWAISEDWLTGPGGERLARLPGHIAYWFAWNNYFGAKSDLYKG